MTKGMGVIFASQIKSYVEENTKAKTASKTITETYLNALYDYGLIDKAKDPRNITRYVYWPINEQKSKTSFIAIPPFNELCVSLCLDKYLKQRFEYSYKHKKIDVNDLIKNVIHPPNFVPK